LTASRQERSMFCYYYATRTGLRTITTNPPGLRHENGYWRKLFLFARGFVKID